MTGKEKLSAVRANIKKRKESLKPHGGQGLVVTRLMRELYIIFAKIDVDIDFYKTKRFKER